MLGDLFGVTKITAMNDLCRALGPHHRNLGCGPGIVEIAAQMLGRHHHIGTAIGLARDDSHLGHRCLAISKEQFGPMLDHATIFLGGAGQEAGHIDHGQDRNVKAVAEPHEPRSLARAVDVQNTRQHHWLVGHNTNSPPLKTDEASDHILGKLGLHFIKVALISQLFDQLFHVVGRVGIVRHQCIKAAFDPRRVVKEGTGWRLLTVVQRQEIHQTAHFGQCFDVILEGGISHGGLFRVGRGAAQFFGGHLFIGHGLDHIRAGHEHVRAILDHEDKVGHRRTVDSASCTGAHDHADLRHNTRGLNVALEHLAIACKAVDTFLNTGTAGIVDPDHRRAVFNGHIHDLADLGRMRRRDGPAQNREVLRKDIDHAAVDGAPPGDNAIPRRFLLLHAEISAAVRDKHIELFERAFVQQQINPFAGCQFTTSVLCIDPVLAATQTRVGAPRFKLCQNVFHDVPADRFRASYISADHTGTIIRNICKMYSTYNLQSANLKITSKGTVPCACAHWTVLMHRNTSNSCKSSPRSAFWTATRHHTFQR